MPAIATVTPSLDQDVDGLLAGVKWAVPNLTYSFPDAAAYYGSRYGSGETADNFAPLNATQKAAVRVVLGMYAAVANITFTEVTESATTHGDLRYAQSDLPDNAWDTFIHETGHALGLKHAHEDPAVSPQHDSMEYTVMTYRSYVGQVLGGGYTNGAWSYAQTPMMYDIAALQYMYGANYASHSGDTTYSWNPATGELSIDGVGQGAPVGNRIFMTVWDGNGIDTYDFSSYATGVTADLHPGAWTTASQAQLAYLGDAHYAAGNIANALLFQGDLRSIIENVTGGAGADTLSGNDVANVILGNAGDDILYGFAGNDRLDGGSGDDHLYGGAGDDQLSGADGNDVLDGGGSDSLPGASGFDKIDGGPGSDTVDFSSFGAAVSVQLVLGADQAWTKDLPTFSGGAWREIATLSNVENVVGTPYDDMLMGDAGNNVLGYTGGFDRLYGSGGTNTADFSRFDAAVSVQLVLAQDQAWTKDLPALSGGAWREIATLGGIENIVGTRYDDLVTGDAQDNVIAYTGGFDRIDGAGGSDTADFSRFGAAVSVQLVLGADQAWTKDLTTLSAGTWREAATMSHVENLTGTPYGDLLTGDASANHIDGGAGSDRLSGGGGADVFHYASANDGVDTITDFTPGDGGDVLDLRDVLSGYAQGVSDAASFVQLGSAGGSTLVSVSVNADGAGSDFAPLATLDGVTGLLLNDLIAHGNLLLG